MAESSGGGTRSPSSETNLQEDSCPTPIPLDTGNRQQQQQLRMCIKCSTPLSPSAKYCNECGASQYPSMLSTVCCSCSVELLKPTQKVCHECGTLQHAQTSMERSGEQQQTAPLTQPLSLITPTLAESSGAVVRSQIPQHHLTSPLVPDSAHGTPDQLHTGSTLNTTANKQTIETAQHLSDPLLHVSPVPSPDSSSPTHSHALLLGPTCMYPAGTLQPQGESPQSQSTTADVNSQRPHDSVSCVRNLNEIEQARKRKVPPVPHGSGADGSRSLASKKLCSHQLSDEKVDEAHQEEGLQLVTYQPPVQEEGTSSTPSPHSSEESPKQQSSCDDVSSPTTSTTVNEDDTQIKVAANEVTMKEEPGLKQDEKREKNTKGRTVSLPEKSKVNDGKNPSKCTEELKQLKSHGETQEEPEASGNVQDRKGNHDASQLQSDKADTNSGQVMISIEGDSMTSKNEPSGENGKTYADSVLHPLLDTFEKPKDNTIQENAKGGSKQASSNSQDKSKKVSLFVYVMLIATVVYIIMQKNESGAAASKLSRKK